MKNMDKTLQYLFSSYTVDYSTTNNQLLQYRYDNINDALPNPTPFFTSKIIYNTNKYPIEITKYFGTDTKNIYSKMYIEYN
jgi:hypothetical protein